MCLHVYPCVCVRVRACAALHQRENCLYLESQVSSRKPSFHPTPGIKPSELMDSRWRDKVNSIHVKERNQRRILRPRCNRVKARAQEKTVESSK